MQTGCRLIKHINGLSCAPLTQFRSKLDSLRLSSGQFRGRLAKLDIRKSHIIQCLYFSLDCRNIFEKFQCLFHGHIQHIVNTLPFIFHFQCFTIVTLSTTYFTRHINIRKKMHLNLDNAVTAAGLAPSAFYIKAETSLLIASGFRVCCGCKKITDHIKHTGISCRI